MTQQLTRRGLLAGLGVGLPGLALPWHGALADQAWPDRRAVNVVFQATGERFHQYYAQGGQFIWPAVAQFSVTVRDWRANKARLMHPNLLDVLYVLHWRYNASEIVITSGYRTPETNGKIEGAAKNSLHMRGLALDIHFPDLDNTAVGRDMARFVPGGVGIYPGRSFTHFDLGAVRRWTG